MNLLHISGRTFDVPLIALLITHYRSLAPAVSHSVAIAAKPRKINELIDRTRRPTFPIALIATPNEEIGQQSCEQARNFERFVRHVSPSWVVLYGDSGAVMPAALACSKLRIPIARVEAGQRPMDRKVPEYIEGVLTDQLSALLFPFSRSAIENLRKEGVSKDKIFYVATSQNQLPMARAAESIAHVLTSFQGAAHATKSKARRQYELVEANAELEQQEF
jgi:UDP-N-acetylglucosamine 2-epimerase